LGFAGASIEGNVDFVEVRATKSAKSERFDHNINYDTTLNAKFCTLEGNLKIKGWFINFSDSKTILDWDGYCFDRNLGGMKGTTTM
jgi:hypothetical protein